MGEERSRLIHLRRPAVLSVLDEPFVPEGVGSSDIDERWESLCAENPAYFDGRLYHVFGVHRNGHGGAVIHVAECAYRYFAVQLTGLELGVRPLGVKGMVWRDGRVLVGLRSMAVAGYPGQWELAPGGSVEPGRTPEQIVLDELAEETGVAATSEPAALAVLYDNELACHEIAFRIHAASPEKDGPPQTSEYSELRWCEPDALPADLTPIARLMRPLLA